MNRYKRRVRFFVRADSIYLPESKVTFSGLKNVMGHFVFRDLNHRSVLISTRIPMACRPGGPQGQEENAKVFDIHELIRRIEESAGCSMAVIAVLLETRPDIWSRIKRSMSV